MFGALAANALPHAAPFIGQAIANPNGALLTAGRSVGRLAGLSGADLGALEDNGGLVSGIPGWFWAVLGVTAGALGGVYLCTRHPDKVPGFLKGP